MIPEYPGFDTAQLVAALQTAALDPKTIGNSTHLLIPPNYSHKDITDLIEKAGHEPTRKRGTIQVKDVASLLAYCADQACPNAAYIYANPDSRQITAIFNDHRRASVPGWRDFRAEFKAEFTPEFANWMSQNRQQKGQTEFAEFIEDNLADIPEPGAQTLLDIATTLQAKTEINFSSAKRLQNGQSQLIYTENINASAGANGALEIPKEFTLGLRIFKNGEGYKLRARLKYRLHSGAVKFWYELDRPERAVEDAFAGYVNEVREKSGYQVLIAAA
jgi:uncharacterized protein YfdQ (DUF2303 family)